MLLVFLPTVTSFTSAKFSLMMLLEPVPRPPHAMFIGDLRRGESLKQKTRTKKGKRERVRTSRQTSASNSISSGLYGKKREDRRKGGKKKKGPRRTPAVSIIKFQVITESHFISVLKGHPGLHHQVSSKNNRGEKKKKNFSSAE